jgi:signal transduction histidine kinase
LSQLYDLLGITLGVEVHLDNDPTSDRDREWRFVPSPDFRVLFESAPGLYLVLTPDLHIVAVTEAYLQATMTTREGILGRHLFDVFPDNPDDPSATGVGNLGASLERVLATRRADVMAIQKYDIRDPASEGGGFEERYWSPINSPVLGPDNQIEYMVHRVEDVTEFVRLKQRGREQDKMTDVLREPAEQMEAEVYLRGQELVAGNQQLRRSNTVLNQLYRQIEELTSHANSGSAAPGGGRASEEFRPDSVAPEEMLARVEELVAARNGLEDRLRQAHKMEAVGQLAGGVAHDFNNLLTVILGYSSLLREGAAAQRASDCVEEIEKAASRAAALTKQLLAFSRKQVLQSRVLNLNDIVTGMKEMLRDLMGEDIVLEIDFDPALENVKADRGQLEQVIINLAVNARDAMQFGGTFRITTGNAHVVAEEAQMGSLGPGSYIRLRVIDTGVGMDAETQARIFEPFFTTKEAGKGTGLGLATVYGIVEQSGGIVSVNSALGRGTIFTILLPVTYESAEEATPSKIGSRSVRGAGAILLVEDEAPLRKLISGTLKRAGYYVLEAGSGKEALSIAVDATRIDLLLTDVVMPGMTGPQLLEILKQNGKDPTTLFMSGYDRELIGKRASDLNFLPKPFTPNELLGKVYELLGAGQPIAGPTTVT